MQFDVCSVDDDADSAVLFLCDDRDRVALAFCMNGGGNMGIEDNLIDHNQVAFTFMQSNSIITLTFPGQRLRVPYASGQWQRVCFECHWYRISCHHTNQSTLTFPLIFWFLLLIQARYNHFKSRAGPTRH